MSTFKDSNGYVVFDGDIDAICDDEVEIGLTKARSLLSSGQWNKTDEEALKTSKANREEAVRNASNVREKKVAKGPRREDKEKKPKKKHQVPNAPPPPPPQTPPSSPTTPQAPAPPAPPAPPQSQPQESVSGSSEDSEGSQSPPLPPSPRTPPPIPPEISSTSPEVKEKIDDNDEEKSSESSEEGGGGTSSSSSSSVVSDPDAPALPPRGDPKAETKPKEKKVTPKDKSREEKDEDDKSKEESKEEKEKDDKPKEKEKSEEEKEKSESESSSKINEEVRCEVHDLTSALSLTSFNPPIKESALFEKRKEQIKEYQAKRDGFMKTQQYKTKVRGKELHEVMKRGDKEITELTSALKKKYSAALKQFEKNTKKNAKRDKRKITSDELKILINAERTRLEDLQESEISNKRKVNICNALESQIAYTRSVAEDVKRFYSILCDVEESQLSDIYTERCAQEYEKYLGNLQKELKTYGNSLKKEEKKKKRSERRSTEEIERDIEEFRRNRDEQQQLVIEEIKKEGDAKMAEFKEERKRNEGAVEEYFNLYVKRIEEMFEAQKEGVVRVDLDVTELPEGIATATAVTEDSGAQEGSDKKEGDASSKSAASHQSGESSSSSHSSTHSEKSEK